MGPNDAGLASTVKTNILILLNISDPFGGAKSPPLKAGVRSAAQSQP
jgi:hypothetical protein